MRGRPAQGVTGQRTVPSSPPRGTGPFTASYQINDLAGPYEGANLSSHFNGGSTGIRLRVKELKVMIVIAEAYRVKRSTKICTAVSSWHGAVGHRD